MLICNCFPYFIKEVYQMGTISTFSKRLQLAMQMRQLRAVDLAEKTGLSQGLISNYKSGRFEASQTNLQKLAVALDVSIPWLMGYDVPVGRYEQAQIESQVIRIAAKLPNLTENQLDIVEQIIDNFSGVSE